MRQHHGLSAGAGSEADQNLIRNVLLATVEIDALESGVGAGVGQALPLADSEGNREECNKKKQKKKMNPMPSHTSDL
jgi:hypothetical protein